MTIKQKITAACAVSGLTVTALGEKMGMSQQNISKRLKTGKFTQEELERMAEIMGCTYISAFQFPDGSRIE
ncbi:MAG: helix-turn-helix domain-containing protein [Eisenbergiella sp.]